MRGEDPGREVQNHNFSARGLEMLVFANMGMDVKFMNEHTQNHTPHDIFF